uniref:KN motif and ankyrin repeat domains 4 n=1 Tax=Hydatigena taeniaeformis TaxID=6205 RepID=A0A0R3WRP7_HYDTA
LRQQRDLEAKCATLASTVRGLQMDLQEKQRMLEAHAQRGRSRSTVRGTVDSTTVLVQLPPQPTPQAHLTKAGAKPKAQVKTTNYVNDSAPRCDTLKNVTKTSIRPATTVLNVEPHKPSEVFHRPQTVETASDLSRSSCLEKRQGYTQAVLKAKENLARLIAEAKSKEEEEGEHNTLKENESKATSLLTVLSTQAYDDWPEFEVAEPLKMQPLPRPVKVQKDIKKTDAVAARGDSMELSETLQRPPVSMASEKTATVISETAAKEEQRELQAKSVDEKEFSFTHTTVSSNAAINGNSAQFESKSQQRSPKEKRVAHSKESRLQHHPYLTAVDAVKDVDSNNTNSAGTTDKMCGTRLASKLFDAQAKSPPPNTSHSSLKQKVVL